MENSSINVYSCHRNLLLYGLQFSNEDLSYNSNLVRENNKLHIEKKVKLLKTKAQPLNTAITNTFTKNIIMIKYNGRYQPVFLPIARYYNKRKRLYLYKTLIKKYKHTISYITLYLTEFLDIFMLLRQRKVQCLVNFLFI